MIWDEIYSKTPFFPLTEFNKLDKLRMVQELSRAGLVSAGITRYLYCEHRNGWDHTIWMLPICLRAVNKCISYEPLTLVEGGMPGY